MVEQVSASLDRVLAEPYVIMLTSLPKPYRTPSFPSVPHVELITFIIYRIFTSSGLWVGGECGNDEASSPSVPA